MKSSEYSEVRVESKSTAASLTLNGWGGLVTKQPNMHCVVNGAERPSSVSENLFDVQIIV